MTAQDSDLILPVPNYKCSNCGATEASCRRSRQFNQFGCCDPCHLATGKTHQQAAPEADPEPLDIHPGWRPILAAPPTLPAPEASRFEEEARGLYDLRAAALDKAREGTLRCGHCFRDLEKDPARTFHVIFSDGSMRCNSPEAQDFADGYARTFVVHETQSRHDEIKARLDIWAPPARQFGKTKRVLETLDRLVAEHPGDEALKTERDNVARTGLARCPTCGSPKPELHPAVQFEGEVQVCRDPWHN